MKTSLNQTAFSNSSEINTFGIVVDLHDEEGRNLAQLLVQSRTAASRKVEGDHDNSI